MSTLFIFFVKDIAWTKRQRGHWLKANHSPVSIRQIATGSEIVGNNTSISPLMIWGVVPRGLLPLPVDVNSNTSTSIRFWTNPSWSLSHSPSIYSCRVDRFLQVDRLWSALDYTLPHAATTYLKVTSPWPLVGPSLSQKRACAIYAHCSSWIRFAFIQISLPLCAAEAVETSWEKD